MYMWLTHFTLQQKLAQRCEATVLQLNKAFIMCVCETESLRSTPETVATLLASCTPAQNVLLLVVESLSCVHLFVTP